MYSKFKNIFRKSYHLFTIDIVEKHCTAGQATNENMAHAHFVLDA